MATHSNRVSIPDAPGESVLVSRGSEGLHSPLVENEELQSLLAAAVKKYPDPPQLKMQIVRAYI